MKINKDVIAREIQGDMVLLNLKTGDYYSLNKVGSDIFGLLKDGCSIDDIIANLSETYDIDKETLSRDIHTLVKDMADNGILET